jgi:alpha-beta hydrolase superfamily lysophospholipase
VRQHQGDPSRCVVLLPGIRYFSQAPLLWFSREAAQAGGWSVVEVDEHAPDDEQPFEWMRGQARRALEAASGAERVVVVGKSLASAAAPMVSGPAVWLTPLLNRTEIAEAIEAATAPTLLIGSTADTTWSEGSVRENEALEVVELDGLDHSLQVSADPLASLDVLRDVTARVASFLERLS